MESQFIQTDALEELGRSKKVVAERTTVPNGEIHPIIKDKRTGRIISGEHRNRKGWRSVQWVTTRDDLEFWTLKMHANVQRQKPQAEFVHELEQYAKVMEKAELPNEQIVKELLAISPYHPNYTMSFIPNHYKSSEGRPKKEDIEFQKSETKTPPGFAIADDGADDSPKEKLLTCKNCGFRGTPIAGYLQ